MTKLSSVQKPVMESLKQIHFPLSCLIWDPIWLFFLSFQDWTILANQTATITGVEANLKVKFKHFFTKIFFFAELINNYFSTSVRAIQKINEDEELTISYMSPLQRCDFHTRESRRKILFEEFGFWCNCNLCDAINLGTYVRGVRCATLGYKKISIPTILNSPLKGC